MVTALVPKAFGTSVMLAKNSVPLDPFGMMTTPDTKLGLAAVAVSWRLVDSVGTTLKATVADVSSSADWAAITLTFGPIGATTVARMLLVTVMTPSLTVTPRVALEGTSPLGVNTRLRTPPVPVTATVPTVASDIVAATTRLAEAVSTSTTLNSIDVALLAGDVKSARPVMIGASFTGVTVSLKVLDTGVLLSLWLTLMVTVVSPVALSAGVMISERSVPLPPRATVARRASPTTARTTRFVAAVIPPSTLKLTVNGVSSAVV